MHIKYIGLNLKALRLTYKLTQIEMAKKVGINSSNYSHIERGVRGISITNLIKICETCNKSLEYMLTDPDINLRKSLITTSKERINQLTHLQLEYLTYDNCRVIYELSIILGNNQDNKEE